jgi:hypothetical protein
VYVRIELLYQFEKKAAETTTRQVDGNTSKQN